MKENDGRAARRKLWRKLSLIVCIFGWIWMVIAVVRFTAGSRLRYQQQQQQEQPQSLLRRVLSRDNHQGKQQRRQHPNLPILSDDDWDRILTARVHLIDLRKTKSPTRSSNPSLSHSLIASFCRIDWNLHKQDPSKYPMYRFLVAASPDCESPIRVDFHQVVQKITQYDQQQQQSVQRLQTPFVVFHESRCGSTLVANVLASMSVRHRVYSESAPPIAALKTICGESYEECDVSTAAEILQHVMYIMQRSESESNEQYAFFKIQSVGTRNLAVFRKAFPHMPFLFVYRDPVQVMVSHLAQGLRSANCVRSQHQQHDASIHNSIQTIVQKYNPQFLQQQQHIRNLPPQHFCAAHLASITEAFLEHCCENPNNNIENREPHHQSLGIPIHYESLPDILYTHIVPQFHLTVDDWDRVHATAQTYSKSAAAKHRGNNNNHDGSHQPDHPNDHHNTFQSDNERKEQAASDLIKQAAHIYLQPSYEKLLALSSQWQDSANVGVETG